MYSIIVMTSIVLTEAKKILNAQYIWYVGIDMVVEFPNTEGNT